MEETGFSGADFLLGLAKEQVDEIVKRGRIIIANPHALVLFAENL